VAVLRGHRDSLTAFDSTIVMDGANPNLLLATAAADGQVLIWDGSAL